MLQKRAKIQIELSKYILNLLLKFFLELVHFHTTIKRESIFIFCFSVSEIPSILSINDVDKITSSNTGTEPPTKPVFPPCGHMAKF